MHNYTGSKSSEKATVFHSEKRKISCAVVGARGYSGLELSRLLLQHPYAELKCCFATSDFALTDFIDSEEAAKVQCFSDKELMNHKVDVVFLATPAEVSLNLAPQLLARGSKVIDLSGAFRLKSHSYPQWYGFEHTESELLQKAEYGLAAWAGPTKSSSLVANPGCYATAITMALVPLLRDDVVEIENIVIDAKSGATGAGKKASESQLFSEVSGDCLAYKVGKHQHLPEIIETLELHSGRRVEPFMSTSLLSERRGIVAAIYANLKPGLGIGEVETSYAKAYAENKLVKFAGLAKNKNLLSLKRVVGTAKTHISYEVIGSKLYLFSCIDNLLKGAAGQAVENFNRINDIPVCTGLTHLEAQI